MDSRLRAVVAAAAVGAALLASGSAVAGTSAPAGSLSRHVWGTAIEVPGAAALNQGGIAGIGSVSCASAGNCSAGGQYMDSSGRRQAFVVSQVNGTWGTAIEVPGTAALNQAGNADISSVSCASAGNCSAGGYYWDGSDHFQAFVVSQVNGTWGTAIEVPGTAALNQGGNASISSVSCASAGNCSAGGQYRDGFSRHQAFVVGQVNGTWHTAIEVPVAAALNQAGNASISSVSCASAGNCSAGGQYLDSSRGHQAFVVSQVNGTWHAAIEVPGTAALNQGGNAKVTSVSCASAGNCSAGGQYRDGFSRHQAFVVGQAGGTWHTAIEVPGIAALNQDGNASISSVSCASAGNCSAGGFYTDSSGHGQVFVVSQVGGAWHAAIEVPAIAALNQGGIAEISSVSCASAGNCGAGGFYTDSSSHMQAFVVSQANGTWHAAIEVPGTAALNQGGNASISSVSCASAGNCSAGGDYEDSFSHFQAFVVSER
jgi:hypothetical protein